MSAIPCASCDCPMACRDRNYCNKPQQEAWSSRPATPAPAAPPAVMDNELIALRDYFAGKALPVVLELACTTTNAPDDSLPGETGARYLARKCYTIADAMLAERAK